MSTLRLPVVFKDGHWELVYGGAVPVKNGSVAELHVDPATISDRQWLATLTTPCRIKVLEAGTPLCVAVRPTPGLLGPHTTHLLSQQSIRYQPSPNISAGHQFVQIHLGGPTKAQVRRNEETGGLWLMFEGLYACGLDSSTVELPAGIGLPSKTAKSLNHALTQLSEVYETWRDSHTGSIYRSVFYQDADEIWYPLNDLRERELASVERGVINKLWAEVQQQMPSLILR